jgi:hypothetical protein
LAVSSIKGIDYVTSQLMLAIQKDDGARPQIALPAVSVAGSAKATSSSFQELSQLHSPPYFDANGNYAGSL